MKVWIHVLNPNGKVVEIDADRWPELSKKGYLKLDSYKDAPVQAPINQADINYVASLWPSDGMGRVGEEVLLALDRLGLKINVIPLYVAENEINPRTKELIQMKYQPSEKTLFFSIPEAIPEHATRSNYVHIPWDTTKAPDIWVETLNKYATKIYPVSDFTRKVFEKSGVKVPMRTIKHGVNFEQFPKLTRDWNGTFRFITSGNLSTRKGTDLVIKAFTKAFKNKKDVELILKSNKPLSWGKLEIPADERIRVYEEPMPHQDYLDLLKESHCYVAASRAEGFGLPALEAMATGMTAIVHNWGGMSMYANDKYNFPFSNLYQKPRIPAPAWHYPEKYSEGGGIGEWSNPSEPKLEALMKYVYEQRDKAKAKADLCPEWCHNTWSWDTSIKRMWDDIQGFAFNSWGEFYAKDTLTKNLVQMSANTHKELFWVIKGYYPDKVREDGTGTGEMAGYLSWPNQETDGVEINNHKIKEVEALDNDPEVVKLIKSNLQAIDAKVKLIDSNLLDYDGKADLIFSQGLLEHLSDEDMRQVVNHQLECAPVVIHSVPNSNYQRLDFGNERLLTDEQYYRIFQDYDLYVYGYFENPNKQSVLVFHRKDMVKPKVSIIMPVYNHKEMTINAIEAARKTSKDYELIVIENGSSDGIEKWLDEQKDIRVIHVSQNIGIPGAKNLGIALAKGEYICFLDNDTIAGEGWLEQLLDVFKDPTVGFTGQVGYRFNKTDRLFYPGEEFKEKEYVEWISHSIFMFPKKTLRQTGRLLVWDKWNLEDLDHSFKLRQQGWVGKLPDKPLNLQHLQSVTAKVDPLARSPKLTEYKDRIWDMWKGFFINTPYYPRLDIGVGLAPAPGYIHADIQPSNHVEILCDAGSIPMPDETFIEVRNAHLIEHFERGKVPALIREWVRILRVGGTLRVLCPDVSKVARQFINREIDLERYLLWTYGGQIDKYDFHYWGYTFDTLKKLFEDAGLQYITRVDNPDGWLEVTGKKTQGVVPAIKTETDQKPPEDYWVGFKMTHRHTFGGGEKYSFDIVKMLSDIFPRFEVISDEWLINPKELGVNLTKEVRRVQDGSGYDLFINLSHFELPEPKGKKNIAVIFYPQYDWKEKLHAYDGIITISNFCKQRIKDLWGLDSQVVYPPVDIDKFRLGQKKKQIISIGRFFHVEGGNNKNQDLLIRAFKQIPNMDEWKLIFVGTVQDQSYFEGVKQLAEGFPNIEFRHEVNHLMLEDLLSESMFLWHGAGYGATNPSSMEHYGIVAVEAMASGCQPLVFNGGGIAELNGCDTWTSLEELAAKTQRPPKYTPQTLREFSKKYSVVESKKQLEKAISLIIKNAGK